MGGILSARDCMGIEVLREFMEITPVVFLPFYYDICAF